MAVFRRFLFPLLASILPALAQQQQAAPVSKDAPGGFVGSQACKACHPDVAAKFFKNPHFKSVASGKESPEHTGCEGCHGPGAAHVKAGGGKTTIPHAFSLMQPGQI